MTKINRPIISNIYRRTRLIDLIESGPNIPITWVNAPGGAGKTTLMVDYLLKKKSPHLWYQVDERDSDIASFFHHMTQAIQSVCPQNKERLPRLAQVHYANLPAFTKNYFEEIFNRLTLSGKEKGILVFDNFQDADNRFGFYDIISEVLEIIPTDIKIFILSRNAPPIQLARLKASQQIQLIQWEDIRFNRSESQQLIALQNSADPEEKTLEMIHQKTEGWAAGLILLARQMRSTTLHFGEIDHLIKEDIFDYLALEIFEQTDPLVQELLLKTSFAEKVSVELATALTKNRNAEQILTQLSRDNYFTQRYLGDKAYYQFHPLFKDFLKSTATNTFAEVELKNIKFLTAEFLEKNNNSQEAIVIYLEIHRWQRAIDLILRHGDRIIDQGLNRTFLEWLRQIPDVSVKASPRLYYYLASCQTPYDLEEARSHFELAFEECIRLSDGLGAYMSWSGIMETYLVNWGDFTAVDRWLEKLQYLREVFPEYPNSAIKVRVMNNRASALFFRKPDHPELLAWMEDLENQLDKELEPSAKMMTGYNLIYYYHTIGGNMPKLRAILDRFKLDISDVDVDILTKIGFEQARASALWLLGEEEKCFQVASNGLRLADEENVHIWDVHLMTKRAFNASSIGDLKQARKWLEEIPEKIDASNLVQVWEYHLACYYEAAHRNAILEMDQHSDTCLSAALEKGGLWIENYARLARARALFLLSREKEARECLDIAESISLKLGNRTSTCGVWEERTLMALELEDQTTALTCLQELLTRLRDGAFVNTPWWNSSTMSGLCSLALEHTIEPEYARLLIKKRKLSPPDQPGFFTPFTAPPQCNQSKTTGSYLKNWPYPVKITIDDELKIDREGKEITVRKKQLGILNHIIEKGGSEVSIYSIVDSLWEDADGDKAYSSFTTTMSRLRKVLGDDCFVTQEGTISINRNYCWVDVLDDNI